MGPLNRGLGTLQVSPGLEMNVSYHRDVFFLNEENIFSDGKVMMIKKVAAKNTFFL